MKKYLPALFAVFVLPSAKLYAQQTPLFSQYMFNKMIYNPAAAGADSGYITAKGLFQDQWLNFHDPEGANPPMSEYGSLEGVVRLKSKQFYIGLGLSYSHNSEGFLNQNEYLVSASCHYLPNFGGDLSLGINAGTVNESLSPTWQTPDFGTIPNSNKTNYAFNAGVGLYYSTKNYYIGFSILNIPSPNLEWGGYPAYYSIYPASTLSAGYNFYINHNKDFELQPSFLLEANNAYNKTYYSYAVSCIFLYKQRFWAGLDMEENNVSSSSSTVTSSSVIAGVIIVKGKFGDVRAGGAYEYVGQIPAAFGGALELTMSARIRI